MKDTTLNPSERVYFSFYDSKKKRMYFNEIREKTKMSISSLQNILAKLEKSREVIKIKEKSNTFYQLKNKYIISLNFTKFDIQRLNSLSINIKMPLNEFLGKIGKIAFIIFFGSASRGQEKKESDIDLLVVMHKFNDLKLNEIYRKEIKSMFEKSKKDIDSKSLYHLSLLFADESEFDEKKDYLLDEARKTGFCIYNQFYYHKRTLEDEN